MNELENSILKIKQGSSLEELTKIKRDIFSSTNFKSLLCHTTHIFDCYARLSRIHDQFMKKALYLAQLRVLQERIGIPPERFCWVTMGSGGRQEQTIGTDQDNGIIYIVGTEEDPEQVLSFIQRFAELGVDYLNQIGYPVCKGNVMATNPRWQKSIEGWMQMITSIGDDESMEDIRFIHIAADFRTIYGDERLGKELRDWMRQSIQQNYFLLERVAGYSLHYEIPMGVFGQMFTVRWGEHAGKFDLKYGAYVPWVNIIRWFAFLMGIRETTTKDRMSRLLESRMISKGEYDALSRAFSMILTLRFDYPDYYLDLSKVSKQERTELKRALKQLKKLRRKMIVIMKNHRRGGVHFE
ncbi:DUF294 nucleotidyltransferase-like domain-containing protein [Tepidibacillus marianensis]|uniref:DUF294 nucleotidyltransferase-like domain-containing protein n=1 Tax=Tepidibacillus marianensis TaxID=3131995 RepID=UPI0030D14E4D